MANNVFFHFQESKQPLLNGYCWYILLLMVNRHSKQIVDLFSESYLILRPVWPKDGYPTRSLSFQCYWFGDQFGRGHITESLVIGEGNSNSLDQGFTNDFTILPSANINQYNVVSQEIYVFSNANRPCKTLTYTISLFASTMIKDHLPSLGIINSVDHIHVRIYTHHTDSNQSLRRHWRLHGSTPWLPWLCHGCHSRTVVWRGELVVFDGF